MNAWEQALFEEEGVTPSPQDAPEVDLSAPETVETQPEGSEGSAETTPEDETEGAEDADLAELGERAQKRIKKLLGRAKGAEEQARALEERLAALEAKQAPADAPAAPAKAATGADDLLAPQDLAVVAAAQRTSVSERIAQLEGLSELARTNVDGFTDPQGKNWSAEQLATIAANAERELRGLAAQDAVERARARDAYEAHQTRFLASARERFPWLKDGSTREHQLAKSIVHAMPELKRFSNWPVALGILTRGLIDFEAAEKGAGGATAGTPGAQAATPGGPVAPVASNGRGVVQGGNGQQQRRVPVAPKVGSGVSSGAPRVAGAAGLRTQQAGRALVEAAAAGDSEGELKALEEMIYGGR